MTQNPIEIPAELVMHACRYCPKLHRNIELVRLCKEAAEIAGELVEGVDYIKAKYKLTSPAPRFHRVREGERGYEIRSLVRKVIDAGIISPDYDFMEMIPGTRSLYIPHRLHRGIYVAKQTEPGAHYKPKFSDLLDFSDRDIRDFRNFGERSFAEFREALKGLLGLPVTPVINLDQAIALLDDKAPGWRDSFPESSPQNPPADAVYRDTDTAEIKTISGRHEIDWAATEQSHTWSAQSYAPPGETIAENMRVLNIKNPQMAALLQLSPETFALLLDGKTPVTEELAMKLEIIMHLRREFWMTLQANYEKAKEGQ